MKNKSTKLIYTVFIFGLLTALFFGIDGYHRLTARSSDDCLACHEDKDLTMEKDGKKISVFVDGAKFKKSKHGEADCKDCHEGYNPEELPHTPAPKKVDCKSCHGDVKSAPHNVHTKVDCAGCHSAHEVQPAKELAKNQTQNCLTCHNKKNIQEFKNTAHFKNNVKCESCHQGGHEVKKISKQEISNTCGKCHNSSHKDFNNSIHQTVFKGGNTNAPTCVDCHGAHKITSSKLTIESEKCLNCHLDEKLFPGTERGSAKFVSEYRTSVHSAIQKDMKPAAGCTDCHGNHMIEHPTDPVKATQNALKVETCGKCHDNITTKFKHSTHGVAFMNNDPNAPSCVGCHGEHGIKSVIDNEQFSKINQTETCLNCHKEGKVVTKIEKENNKPAGTEDYKLSVHYIALQEGKTNSATCSSCHGAHEMNSPKDTLSNIHPRNIANTCGQSDCHVKIKDEFSGSIHQTSLTSKLNSDAPSCVTCHGNHQVLKKDDPNNPLASSVGIVQLCSDCHGSVKIIENNELPKGISENYKESFHGLAIRGGSKEAADCGSCHGVHDIRPSSDPLSSINKKNLPETCGKCHPGATEAMFTTPIHVLQPETESPWMYWVTKLYMFLIVAVIGGMILHNILDLRKKIKTKDTH